MGRPQILAHVGWHQGVWLPAYWEFCKVLWATRIGDEWEVKYLPMIMKPYERYNSWDYFVFRLGQ